MKSVVTTIIGFFTFGGVEPTVITVIGVTMNTIGGILYTFTKYKEKREKHTECDLNKTVLDIEKKITQI